MTNRKSHSFANVFMAAVTIISGMPLALAQLSENCTVSVLNRTVRVNADGTWVLPNVPADFGPVRARATCINNGVTTSGESDYFTLSDNGIVNLPQIILGNTTPIPSSLTLSAPTTTFSAAGQTAQLTVTASYSGSSNKDVTAGSAGTLYRTTNAAIASVSADGLVTAGSATGTAIIQAENEGAQGILSVQNHPDGPSHGGIPDSWSIANGLDPNDPTMPMQDPDHDGLTNLQEYQYGTDPHNPDTDGDGLTDGDEVNKYHTNPLLADTDGDGIPDGVEIQTGTDPLNPASYDLAKAAATSALTPATFTLTTSALVPAASVQLSWNVTLIDGKTTLDLTSDPRTSYSSSNLSVCNFGGVRGQVFAGSAGSCVITASQNTLSRTASGTVQTFTLQPLSYLAIPGFANNVKVSGRYAYVAAGAAGLQVVDVGNKSSPAIVASLAIAGNANDLRIAGNTLYLVASTGLKIIDITNPLQPALLGSLNTTDTAWDVAVSGTLAYIAAGSAGLVIADVSNPAHPVAVGTLAISGGTAKGVAIAGNYAVIAASTAGVVIADITNPSAPARLGSVIVPGDPRKVAINGSFAFIAPYPESEEVVDFSNPRAPVLVAETDPTLGGRLQDILVTQLAGRPVTFGADVYFVNGVPIVDVSQPNSPVPLAILWFSNYRDDNGHGIDVDGSFVYMTGEEGNFTDLGTTGDTRLYIGQYNKIVDNGGIPPTVQITYPTSATTLIQGSRITVTVAAVDDVAVAAVSLLVNGAVVATLANPDYKFSYTVPATATSVTFGATAIDYGNNIGTAVNVTVPVIPDPGTTVTGYVMDTSGAPVVGATVTSAGSSSATTGADGSFAIKQVPTIQGNVQALATFLTGAGRLAGISRPVPPVLGGTTNVGTITVAPIPVISSLSLRSALAGSQVSLQITGSTLNGASFAFQPLVSTPIAVSVGSVAADGTSAVLNLTIPATAIGSFVLVATNIAGNSNTSPTSANRFTVVDPNSRADTDGDGFQDVVEALFGTDPTDPTSFPVIPVATETESVAFSVLNAPVTGAGIRETESVAFSVLNAPVTGAGIRETESVVFSVLNAPVTGAGIRETESVAFSVLNAPVTEAGIRETESVAFSVLNAPAGSAGIREAESYFSVVNNAVGVSGPKPAALPESSSPANTGTGTKDQPAQVQNQPIDPFLDSDGDGLPDWFEVMIGTDPYNPDTDGDGLTDFQELFVYHTNPLDPDTDGDGFTDGVEILFGSDPLNPNSTPLNATRRAAVIQASPAGAAKIAANNGTKNKSALQGDAYVELHSKKQTRGKSASAAVSGSFAPRWIIRWFSR